MRKIPWEGLGIGEFEAKFRKAFHREMTPEERNFLHLAEQIFQEDDPEEKAKSTALSHLADY